MITYRLLLVFIVFYSANMQAYQSYQNDSLAHNDYQFFEAQIQNHTSDTLNALRYAKAWLYKAKKENNSFQEVKAYKNIMHLVERKYRMIYADSLLMSALDTNDNAVIGSAYLTIGAAYYNNRRLSKALDHYLIANNYLQTTNNLYLKNKLKYTIAQTKYYLGYYQEAIALFSECILYFKEENEMAYLNSLHAISLCYNKIERFDLCSFNNQLGIQLSEQLEVVGMIPYFKNSEGINQYDLKNYDTAIQLLNQSLPELERKNDYVNQMVTWFYLGKSNATLGNNAQAIRYFLKVNETVEQKKVLRPDIRENFELLIRYYETQNDLEQQLYFIEKLLDYDKELNSHYKYLSYKLHKEYDTKSLVLKKQHIQDQLAFNKILFVAIIVVLCLVIIAVGRYHFRSKKRAKQKFDALMKSLAEKKKTAVESSNQVKTTISPELTESLLKSLEKFEANKAYIEKDMNLTKLAALLNTNTKYASLVIAHHRGKKTTTYINDLKIDYIVALLLSSSKFRNYTNKALGEEAGFGSTQIFTLSFKKKTGLSPTTFIEQLNNSLTQ